MKNKLMVARVKGWGKQSECKLARNNIFNNKKHRNGF